MRPERLILVTGTGTGVGKTWVAAQLARAWRASGSSVAARKPAQSFEAATGRAAGDPGPPGAGGAADARAGGPGTAGQGSAGGGEGGGATDAEVLAGATGEEPHQVCPEHRWYPLAMAPPIAAEALARPAFTVAELAAELRWPTGPRARYGVIEGAGGPRSPLAADGDTVSLAELLRPDHVVIVAGAGLGAINAVLLAAGAFAGDGPVPVVLLNRFDGTDPVHVANLAWLQRHTDLVVTTDIAGLAGAL